MEKTFEQLVNKILKNSGKQLTRFFDKLLLEGDLIQNIYQKINELQIKRGGKRYKKLGKFIEDGTFWGHIGARIKKEYFVLCIDNKMVLRLNKTDSELKIFFDKNVYIKLIGSGNDIVEECNK